jgi:hypothetical protein
MNLSIFDPMAQVDQKFIMIDGASLYYEYRNARSQERSSFGRFFVVENHFLSATFFILRVQYIFL